MPELWENCNARSRELLADLYKYYHGCFPDWHLSGKQKPISTSGLMVKECLEDISTFMARAPSRLRGDE